VRESDPLAASIWAVNAAIESGHDDAVDAIVREGEAAADEAPKMTARFDGHTRCNR